MTPRRSETCSWLTYYFHEVVFLTVVDLFLFILQYNRLHKVKKPVQVGVEWHSIEHKNYPRKNANKF